MVGIKLTCDTSATRAALHRFAAETMPTINVNVLRSAVNPHAARLVQKLPYDTGRLRNSFADAATKVGMNGVAKVPLRVSKQANYNLGRLETQVDGARKRVEWFEANGRAFYKAGKKPRARDGSPRPEYRKALRALKASITQLERYKAGSIGEDGQSLGEGTGLLMFNKKRHGFRTFVSIRSKVYGGEGSLGFAGVGLVRLRLKSLEPHSRQVERRNGFVRNFEQESAASVERELLAPLEGAMNEALRGGGGGLKAG